MQHSLETLNLSHQSINSRAVTNFVLHNCFPISFLKGTLIIPTCGPFACPLLGYTRKMNHSKPKLHMPETPFSTNSCKVVLLRRGAAVVHSAPRDTCFSNPHCESMNMNNLAYTHGCVLVPTYMYLRIYLFTYGVDVSWVGGVHIKAICLGFLVCDLFGN